MTPSPDELKQMVEEDKRVRELRTGERIKALLEEERCSLTPVVVLTAGNVQASVEIRALD